MDHSAIPAFTLTAFPFFFAGLWSGICWLLAAVGGWRRLAKSFPAPYRPSGKAYYLQSGQVGSVTYNGCLIIHTSRVGFYLSILLPFRLGHPPLFVPWEAIHHAVFRRFLWAENVTFEVGFPGVATMRLPKRIFEGQNVVL